MTPSSEAGRPTRSAWLPGAAVFALAATLSCGDGGTEPRPPDPTRPTTVAVSPATAELAALGATVQLSAEVRDQGVELEAAVDEIRHSVELLGNVPPDPPTPSGPRQLRLISLQCVRAEDDGGDEAYLRVEGRRPTGRDALFTPKRLALVRRPPGCGRFAPPAGTGQ